ncbi:MAG: hypothetical protein IT317_17915 [Anaerolineales bacterium]|nr:hypothetical protein [Anaerolineales bacterium]
MPLSLALVFHFNQHTNENIALAARACYRGLLLVLRKHPRLKFNLHLSGTLLRGLPWFDAECLALVRAGLAAGQFELLGSTYAQNVPYASDDWDNAQQIALHRAVLRELFGVSPTSFWISERSWRQSLLPLIAEGGYTVTPVEDHMLRAAGAADPAPVRATLNDQALTLVSDDTRLRTRFNYAAWFGRRAQLFKYLHGLAAQPGAEQFFVTYAEDAEAMGLWGWQAGYLPQAHWQHLDHLLSDLDGAPDYALRHLSEARAMREIGPLPDGAAEWMDAALRRVDAPYHEDGYADWFDFLQRAPKQLKFQHLFGVVRARLQALGSARADPGYPRPAQTPGDVFFRQALEAFCHHQYEFGCIGVGGPGYWGWENVRSALTLARAAELADDPQPGRWIEDVNGDGADEIVLSNGRQAACLTSYGGRLLYWFDTAQGREWVGNQLAVPPATYNVDVHTPPAVETRPLPWLPEAYEANTRAWPEAKQKEALPTHMGRHLPPWVFEGEPSELTTYPLPVSGTTPRQLLTAQTGALFDSLRVDGGPETPQTQLLDFRFEGEGLTFLLFPLPELYLQKQVTLADGGLNVRYVLDNRDAAAHKLVLRTSHELTPDYAQGLAAGRAAYTYTKEKRGGATVRNTVTGAALRLHTRPAAGKVECDENLLALRVTLTFRVALPPRTQSVVEIKLRHAPPAAA